MSLRARLLRPISGWLGLIIPPFNPTPTGPAASTMVTLTGDVITDQTGDPMRTIQNA